jgi:hypothetical protein
VSRHTSNVIREYTNACPVEVLESNSGDTDTIIVTFDGTVSNGCKPKLAQWGIDMADPVGVDTPQGNQLYQVMTTNTANLPPSPSGAGLQNNAVGISNPSPPQVHVEFDPPVSSVEFYYSFPHAGRAYWNGTIQQPTESVMVYGVSRLPGSLNYDTWASKKLYSNNPQLGPGVPWSVWDPVKLVTSQDRIQWLWINGYASMDRLMITRTPMSCTSHITRGNEVVCKVTSSSWTVTGWEFNPDNTGGLTIGPVQETTSNREWRGVAVATGVVTAHLTNGVTQRNVTSRFTVNNRASPWGQGTNWTYFDSIVPVLDSEPLPNDTVTYGRNCADSLPCITVGAPRVQPDPFQNQNGFTAAEVSSGPNKGYWYIASSKYFMHRHSMINPAIYDTSHWTHPVANPTNQCRNALGFGPKAAVTANWNRYSNKCKGVNTPGFVGAVLGHEGMGYGASGKGHEGMGRAVAGDGVHDPHKAVDPLVYPNAGALFTAVDQVVQPLANEIDARSDDNPNTEPQFGVPSNNWPSGQTVWLWSGTAFVGLPHPSF